MHPDSSPDNASHNAVFLKNDRIFEHQLMSIHYTTYDVRRRRDIIHPGSTTAHRDIMGLLTPDEQTDTDRFWFAHVLGIFHANVIYTGDGASDYDSRRLDFLWVRYYSKHRTRSLSRSSLKMLEFPPVSETESFGFINPSTVLRCCHIIPAFSMGRRKVRLGSPLSICAKSTEDWAAYYINRSDPFIVLIPFSRFNPVP
jgi:hypothetical protein